MCRKDGPISVRKELCLRLIISVYPLAFEEFFNITERIDEDDEQLLQLCYRQLVNVEDALRQDDMPLCLQHRVQLADAFERRDLLEFALVQLEKAIALAAKFDTAAPYVECQLKIAIVHEKLGTCRLILCFFFVMLVF